MIHGYPVAAGAVLGLLAARLWHYHRLPRLTAWLFGLAAGLMTIGVTVWLDALAGLTATGTGLTVLLAVLLIGGISWWFEGVRKHKHHRIWTPVLGIVFGTAVVLGIGEWGALSGQAGKSPGKVSSALSQAVQQVRTGQAAAAVPPNHRVAVLLAGLGVVALLVFLAIHHERTKGKGAGAVPSGTRPPAAIPGGSSRTSGRRPAALPAGRGRRR
jgi:drug/metabolite transporter (DMT)-like permease